jgi:glucose/arabinose dehydrogenase
MYRIACAIFLTACFAHAQPLQSARVATGLTNPVFATTAPNSPNTMYIVQKNGTVRTFNASTNTLSATPFANLATIGGVNLLSSGGEQGLMGMAFHPDFANNGFVYFNHTITGNAQRVSRFTVSGGVLDTASRVTVIDIPKPVNTNHNAGWIGFNAVGGNSNLYIATGDSGGSNDPQNVAQNLNSLQGKMLRINVDGTAVNGQYSIPAGNMSGVNVRQEIYAYGLRNPYRNSFDRATGHLYIADVGQNNFEEINYIANGTSGGSNFGWRVREGKSQNPAFPNDPIPAGAIDPFHDYDHTVGQSITGGYVYRGPNSELNGTYFYADYVSGRIWTLRYDGTTMTNLDERTDELQIAATGGGSIGNVSSFAEDGFGNMYIIDYSGGELFRIVPVPEPGLLLVAGAGLFCVRAGRQWSKRGAVRNEPAPPS